MKRFTILILLTLFTTGCTAALPIVTARRLNDRSITLPLTPRQTEPLVITTLSQMNGEVRWIQRTNPASHQVHHSIADSLTIHGTWTDLKEDTQRHFVVDITNVPNQPQHTRIRIGMASYGNSQRATEFTYNLLGTYIENYREPPLIFTKPGGSNGSLSPEERRIL